MNATLQATPGMTLRAATEASMEIRKQLGFRVDRVVFTHDKKTYVLPNAPVAVSEAVQAFDEIDQAMLTIYEAAKSIGVSASELIKIRSR